MWWQVITKLNPGDNIHCQGCLTKWATVKREIRTGDILMAEDFDATPHVISNGQAMACWGCGDYLQLNHHDVVILNDQSEGAPERCTCDFYSVILVTGCQCGGS